eukprot:9478778-Pyramimonas_sp.AAC.1
MDLHETQRDHASAVHLSIHTRVDKGVRAYVQSPKNGPEWDHVVRRVTRDYEPGRQRDYPGHQDPGPADWVQL